MSDSSHEPVPEQPGGGLRGPIFHSQDVSRSPGVYVFRNKGGEVIYVGKAKNLRNRMRSYFAASTLQKSDARRRALINSICSYQTFEVASENEALLLEARFIKQYHPRYNVDWRDDKRYLHICLDLSQQFPRFEFARLRRDDGKLYFGPFPQSRALREIVRMLEIRYHLRSCQVAEPNLETKRHCLEHIIRDCSAPCSGEISVEDYRRQLELAMQVLKGESAAAELAKEIQAQMQAAAAKLDFEEAARLRDMLENIKTVLEPGRRFVNQTISSRSSLDNREGVESLREALDMQKPPLHIECFDMSNISGVLAVGSMVSFRNGRPATGEYRRYRIRDSKATDDTAFMREVLKRRYSRVLRENLKLPDLVVLDGGAGQLGAALQVFSELNMPPTPLIGLAEKQEQIYLPGINQPLSLSLQNPGLKLLQALRDEAHRFANAYHRELRNKKISNSVLADIPGIGPKRQQALLQHFGSVKRISQKSAAELAAEMPGLGLKTAARILEYLQKH
ncbi:MAG: excinuclease ABC subunit UvrC [Lentisphaeria bacterium]|nr:excinuclease ABC subunit UvrC [Lentisphaeria bacterium]MDY0176930.1 excinuclease ABC subunit UvrC [Lentisphaeria bacterium]